MIRILITGSGSFVGQSFEFWLKRFPDRYSVDTIDMKDRSWKEYDFTGHDVVFHVAGIAHVSSKGIPDHVYYRVNRDLAIETAQKAKQEGIRQFVFMSSIMVYGVGSQGDGVITRDTVPNPSSVYGRSKLQAEEAIRAMESGDFRVVIVRSPMIYGKGSKGNYPKLARVAKILPLFPDVDNRRSMIHIDNLCEFVRLMIDNEESGLFFPQNREYVKTSEMVRLIAKVSGRSLKLTRVLNPLIEVSKSRLKILDKVFGDLAYEQVLSDYREDYRVRDLKQSIVLTEELPEGLNDIG